jgi:hypothetical protein
MPIYINLVCRECGWPTSIAGRDEDDQTRLGQTHFHGICDRCYGVNDLYLPTDHPQVQRGSQPTPAG